MLAPSTLAARFAPVLRPDQIVTASRLSARDPGYCETSLDCGVLLLPESTAEVSAICSLANATGIGLVPHGGLTGLVEGTASHPGQVAISLERMARVLRIDPDQRIAEVEAGAVLQDVIEAAAEHGLMPGLDIPSRGSARIGGLLSTNAGGIRVLRYGMARQNVLGLEAVLANGGVLDAMNCLQKNNAGFDLKHLFIGAEGTLGVITRAVIALVPRPRETRVALVAAERFEDLAALLGAARSRFDSQLLSFEVMWPEYYRHTTAQAGFGPLPLAADHPIYAILETGHWHPEPGDCPLTDFLGGAFEEGQIIDAAVAQNEAQRSAIWRAREDGDSIEGHFGACIDYDVGMELAAIPGYVARLRARIANTAPEHPPFFYGHIGDGNLHVTFGLPPGRLAERALFDDAIYGSLDGAGASTVSAEHGIGEEKRAVLPLSRDATYLSVMAQLKACLDPKGIMNPGKVLPT